MTLILIGNSISYITKKMSRCIGIRCKLRQFVNRKMLKNIYYSLIYPHLVYAVQVWGSACASEMNDNLPIVQGPLHPSTPLFYNMEILS